MSGRKQQLILIICLPLVLTVLVLYYKRDSIVSNVNRGQPKDHFKVVSAVSSNHYQEAKDMIASAQRFLPTTRIVVYDLGLQETEREELKSFCNVEVRTFHFEHYPPHFKDLPKCAWKPEIIRTVAHEADYTCWADASIRFGENFDSALAKLDKFPLKGRKHPFKMVQVTSDASLQYLNMSREKMQNVIGVSGGLLLIKTNSLAMNLIDLWCQCSLHEACISPIGTSVKGCNFTKVTQKSLEYIGCHRYDQSVLNVLIVQEYGNDVYRHIFNSVVTHTTVVRHPSKMYLETLKKCQKIS